MEISEIGIIGKGKMGKDIFNYLLPFDSKIILVCRKPEDIPILTEDFQKQLRKMHKRGFFSDIEYERKKQSIFITNDYSKLKNCDCVIESVIEDKGAKQGVFEKLEEIVSKDCILATNTSSIPLRVIFQSCQHKHRCIGIHFFFPVKLIRTVEVNLASFTSRHVVKKVKDFLTTVDKLPFILKEEANFIINRVYTSLITQIYKIYEENYLSIEEIDGLMKDKLLTFGLFEIIDSVGLTIVVETIKNLMEERYLNLYTPLLVKGKELIQKGYKGGLNSKGLADYEKEHSPVRKQLEPSHLEQYKNNIVLRMQSLLINELAYFIKQKQVKEEIGEYVQEVLGLKENPFHMLTRIGKKKIKGFLQEYYNNSKDTVYKPIDGFY